MIKSPFTCYDWNRKLISGNLRSLSEIVPIIKPNYDDLIKSRRGIKSYIKDLDNKVITFQKYFFDQNRMVLGFLQQLLRHSLQHSDFKNGCEKLIFY